MIYKAFAAVTLIAAPIIVLTVQSFVPRTNQPTAPSAVAPVPPVTVANTPAVSAPVNAPIGVPPGDAASFGQPVPDAGKPVLAPGAGLPPITVSQPFTPDEARPPQSDKVLQ
ncbi:hypothetical protein [Sphingobium sp. EM0848]|uniref:hypothetical protein n=1 Tax=Sphingobium sp. EM0848 TaxID=2743473 RepID=UPI00159CB7DC|nr:hypothetical protein [Sphingobium sp. EM0848]